MTAVSGNSPKAGTLEVVLVALVFAALPFPWITLGSAGDLSLKPIHVLIPLLAVVTALHRRMRFRPPEAFALIILSVYGIRVCIDLVSLLWARDPWYGLIELLRQSVNFGLGALLFLALREMSIPRICAAAVVGVGLQLMAAITLFAVALVFSGQNPLCVLTSGLLGGDFRAVKEALFVGGLRALGVAGSLVNQREVAGNDASDFGGALLLGVVFATHLRGYASKGWMSATTWRRVASKALSPALLLACVCALFFVLVSRSDRVSVFLFFVVSVLGTYLLIDTLTAPPSRQRVLVALVFFATLPVAPVAVWMGRDEIGAKVSGILDNPRFTDLREILPYIDDAPIAGRGFGTPTGGTEGAVRVASRYPHNLWLSDFAAYGVIGIATAGLWFGALLLGATTALVRSLTAPPRSRRRARFRAAAIGISYAIMTTQIASMGQLFFIGWFALAVGMVLAEREDNAPYALRGTNEPVHC